MFDFGDLADDGQKLAEEVGADVKEFLVGDVVKGLFLQAHWYLATVEKVNDDGTCQVEWDDGDDVDRTKKVDELKLVRRARNPEPAPATAGEGEAIDKDLGEPAIQDPARVDPKADSPTAQDAKETEQEDAEARQIAEYREKIREELRIRKLRRQAANQQNGRGEGQQTSSVTEASESTLQPEVSAPLESSVQDAVAQQSAGAESEAESLENEAPRTNAEPDGVEVAEPELSAMPETTRTPSMEIPQTEQDVPRYCISGSWSDWKPEVMEWDDERQLHVFQIRLGTGGWESFQILCDGDYTKCLHPDRTDACPYSHYNLCGPDDRGHDLNWTIGAHELDNGAPGAQYEVRLKLSKKGRALLVDWEQLQSKACTKEQENKLKADALPEVSTVSPDAVPMPSFESPLDGPRSELAGVLAPIREFEMKKVADKMKAYDGSTRFPRFQDAQYWNRDQYEAHLRGEALKEIRAAVNRYKTQGSVRQLWKITGGKERGGVIARNGHEVTSSELREKLSTNALVEEVEVKGDRLHYKLIDGTGPPEGWVTIRIIQGGIMKNLALKTTKEQWENLHGVEGAEQLQAPPPQLIVVALMAVHISSSRRLVRFQHVLRSIEQQSLPWANEELEFVVGLSWSAAAELEAGVQSTLDSFSAARQGLTVVVGQKERHMQFQHFAAALSAVERKLNERSAANVSTWLIFGDDDDLWHSKRVAEYVMAIRRHSVLDAVGLFATTTRVNCAKDKIKDEDMPVTEKEVDHFLTIGRGKRTDHEEASREWFKRLRAAGNNAATIPYSDDLGMEYFHLCPRLRVVQEFFATTEKTILAHRYCDLRFAEYLLSYPRFGQELGLEVSWFEPNSWMYFYACPMAAEGQWDKSIECQEEDDLDFPPESVGIEGHMATEVKVEKDDVIMAGKSMNEFKSYDAAITQQRLTRYWAAFRNYIELSIVPRHKGKLDQRVFDGCVYMAVNNSFGQFAEQVMKMPTSRGERAARMMFKAGQDFAKTLAKKFEVGVLWHFPEQFMEPAIEDQDWADQNKMPNYPVQQPGFNSPYSNQAHYQQLAFSNQTGLAGKTWQPKHPTHFAYKQQPAGKPWNQGYPHGPGLAGPHKQANLGNKPFANFTKLK